MTLSVSLCACVSLVSTGRTVKTIKNVTKLRLSTLILPSNDVNETIVLRDLAQLFEGQYVETLISLKW